MDVASLRSYCSRKRTKWRPRSLQEWHGGAEVTDPAEAHPKLSRSYEGEMELKTNPPALISQLSVGEIGSQQIRAETQNLYLEFAQLEAYCTELTKPHVKHNTQLSDAECKRLVAFHKQFLHTAHDLLLAAQYPSSDQKLKSLPREKGIAIRVWKHGIHTILEIFRHRLPQCREYLDLYVRSTYAMIGLFYESLIDFKLVWLECLGDVARYMMAIEQDSGYRSVLNKTANTWYQAVLDETPTIGRLSHHQAVLSGSAPLKQLVYYIVALSTETPFLPARPAISSFFSRVLRSSPSMLREGSSSWIELMLLKIHALYYVRAPAEELGEVIRKFTQSFATYVHAEDREFKETGFLLAITRTAFLLHYPVDSPSTGRHIYLPVDGLKQDETAYRQPINHETRPYDGSASRRQDPAPQPKPEPTALQKSNTRGFVPPTALQPDTSSEKNRTIVLPFTFITMSTVYGMEPKASLLAYVHGTLVSLLHLVSDPKALAALQYLVPWEEIAQFVRTMEKSLGNGFRAFSSDVFPTPEEPFGCGRALPEDYWLVRVVWAKGYLPEDHFEKFGVSQDERDFQKGAMDLERVRRCLYLVWRIAMVAPRPPLQFDDDHNVTYVPYKPSRPALLTGLEVPQAQPIFQTDPQFPPVPVGPSRAPTWGSDSSADDLGNSGFLPKDEGTTGSRSTPPSSRGPSRPPSQTGSILSKSSGDTELFTHYFNPGSRPRALNDVEMQFLQPPDALTKGLQVEEPVAMSNDGKSSGIVRARRKSDLDIEMQEPDIKDDARTVIEIEM